MGEQVNNGLSYDKLSEIIYDYYLDGGLTINPKIFNNIDHKKVFNGLIAIVDELKFFGINSDDFMNYTNLGFNKQRQLAYFDIGYGNYFEDFDEHPNEIDLNERDLGIEDGIINKIVSKYTDNKAIKLGEGGNFGVAYDIGNDKILKFTKDKTEAINSKKLIGKTPKHLSNIYDVKFFRNGDNIYYIILLEKLQTTDRIHRTLLDMNEVIIKNQNNNFDNKIIEVIGKKHPIVSEFLYYMCEFGYDETWKKYKQFVNDYPQYDFNDISEISEWILGSATNTNKNTDEVPDHIIQYVKELL